LPFMKPRGARWALARTEALLAPATPLGSQLIGGSAHGRSHCLLSPIKGGPAPIPYSGFGQICHADLVFIRSNWGVYHLGLTSLPYARQRLGLDAH
jgi:hypothetical protein